MSAATGDHATLGADHLPGVVARSAISNGDVTVTADQWAKVNGYDAASRTYRHDEATS